jgi:hypothetical protein
MIHACLSLAMGEGQGSKYSSEFPKIGMGTWYTIHSVCIVVIYFKMGLGTRGVADTVEHLPSKLKALCSNPQTQ